MAAEKPLFVRMPPELHRLVRATAKREDRSMASVAREALRRYCAKGAK